MSPHASTVLVIFFYTFVSSTKSSGKMTISVNFKFIFPLYLIWDICYLTIDFPIVSLRHLKFNNIGRETDEAIECDVSVSPQVLWSIIKYYYPASLVNTTPSP